MRASVHSRVPEGSLGSPHTTAAHIMATFSGLLLLMLCWLSVLAAAAAAERGRSQRRGGGAEKRRKLHRVQHGACSYTFMLPELDGCRAAPPSSSGWDGGAGAAQRDSPPVEGQWSARKLQHLESKMENNTQWLQKVRSSPSTSR